MGYDPYYGQQQPPQPYYPPPAMPNSTNATLSLIASILGLTLLPTIGSILGLILGYSAKSEINRSMGRMGGNGMATWGIILGWLGVGLAVTGICLAVLFFTGAFGCAALEAFRY